MVGNPIQIYNSQNGKRKLCADSFVRVLEKIPDESSVAVVSMTGPAKGKSSMLNFCKEYLESQCSSNWFSKKQNPNLVGFVWGGGAQRKTAGIWIWSEPFYIQSEGESVAVILMDAQGTFDDKTSLAENSLIFSLCINLSSTFIYNVKNDLDDGNLQFLEYFANTSADLQTEITAPAGTSTRTGPAAPATGEHIFQDLVLLIRDWHWPDNYSHGWHSSHDYTSEKNYMRDFSNGSSLDSDEEILQLRQQILSRFNSTSAFFLSHPGLDVSMNKTAMLPEFDKIQDNFKNALPDLMSNLFLRIVKPRKIYGQIQTRERYVEFIIELAEYINNSSSASLEELLNESNLSDLVTKAHLSNQVRQVANSLHEELLGIAAEGLSDEAFIERFKAGTGQRVADFEDLCKTKFPKFKDQFLKMLKENVETSDPYIAFNTMKRTIREQEERMNATKSQGEELSGKISDLIECIQRQQQSLENFELQMASARTVLENEMQRLLEEHERLVQEQARLNQSHASQTARLQQIISERNFGL